MLMKLDPAGNMQWLKSFGFGETDWFMYVQQTTDGGYIVAGATINPNPRSWDGLLLKTDASGNTQWSKVFQTVGTDFFKLC